MIRTFAKCGNTMERIHFLQSLNENEYTLEDLHNLCDIMSFEPGALAKESLLHSMIDELKARIVAEGCELEKVSKRVSAIDLMPVSSGEREVLNMELADPFAKILISDFNF